MIAQFGIFLPDDLSHLELGKLFRNDVGIEHAALHHRLVLDEAGDDLIEVFAADARCLDAFRQLEALDLEMHLAVVVDPAIRLTFLVPAGTISEPRIRSGIIGRELAPRAQPLLLPQTDRTRPNP